MKVLVMGSGAVGGYFGGLLSRSGEDVTFVARGANLEAIRQRGLRVESLHAGNFTIHPPAIERPDGTWKPDLVLFCVKGYHNEQAIEVVRPAVGDDTTILTLQNGIGSGDQLSKAFGQDKVLVGAAYVEAKRKELGVIVERGAPCRIVFGEVDGRQSARAVRVRDAFQRAGGVEVELSSNVIKALWDKLVFICALSGMTCITRAPFPQVLDTPETLDLTWRIVREAAEVGKAKRVGLEPDIVESTMTHLQEHKDELSSSMYLDLERGNPLEVGVLNGAVSRAGKEVGVPTPVNDFITTCLTVADREGRARLGLPLSA